MKYIFYSQYAESYFLARILKKLGHEVYFYIADEAYRMVGKNMEVPIIENFYMQLDKMSKIDTLIVFDCNGKGDEADFLRSKGYPVVGSSLFADELEDNRNMAGEIFKGIIDVPPTKSFTSFDDALLFLRKQKFQTRYVFKPDNADTPKDWTYVSKDIDDLESRLAFYKANWKSTESTKFQLQLVINGIECDFGGWRSIKGWFSNSFEWYFENKKQQNGNLGPAVGCADAFEYFTTVNEPYFQRYLSKMGEILAQHKYTGNFSVNNIYSPEEDKFYMLEVNDRFGYFALQNQIYALIAARQDPAKLLDACAGLDKLPQNYFPLNSFAFNVGIYIPPYPNEKGVIDAKGSNITMNKSIEKNFMPSDVYFSKENNRMECAGTSGLIGTMGVCGKTIDGTIDGLYERIMPNIDIANVAYRTDGGKRVKKDIQKLRQCRAIL